MKVKIGGTVFDAVNVKSLPFNTVAIGCTRGIIFLTMSHYLANQQILEEYCVYRIKEVEGTGELICLVLKEPVVLFIKDKQLASIINY